jgi:hypothetical protein
MILRKVPAGHLFGSVSLEKLEHTHDISSCCHDGGLKNTSKKHLRPVSLEKLEQTHDISSCGHEDGFKSTSKETPAAPNKIEPTRKRSTCGQ